MVGLDENTGALDTALNGTWQYTQIKMRSDIESVQVPPVTLVRIQNSAPVFAMWYRPW